VWVEHGSQLLVFDLNAPDRLLGGTGILGRHGRDRLADESDPVARQDRDIADASAVQDPGYILAGQDGVYAGSAASRG
jgi:hypothetical protein